MKIFLLALFFLIIIKANAQFTYEQTYNWQLGQESLFLTDIGNFNYKYVVYDYWHDKFSLYNIDHSPFMLNIILPVSTDSGQAYQIGYITNSLFDCDSNTVEYAIFSGPIRDSLNFFVY